MSQDQSSSPVGILANPMAGRDVRRLAARAATSTIESKRNQVVRAAIGAAAAGVERIVVAREPLRIATGALEHLAVDLDVETLDIGAKLDASDTGRIADAMQAAGCEVVVVLGGDGTNRALAKAWPGVLTVSISTGTNNVFPTMVEATLAGAAAGLVAARRISPEEVATPCKVVKLEVPGQEDDLALVDVALLAEDSVGNLMPVEPGKIRAVALARSEPAAVGLSAIGGLLLPASAADDFGVLVRCVPHDDGGRPLLVPLSPGLYRTVHVDSVDRVALDEPMTLAGPGVLAFDGDRERVLAPGELATLRISRSGPRVIDVARALSLAAQRGLYLDRGPFRDRLGLLPDCC